MPLRFPMSTTGEIFGLLEILNDYGGDEDIARLADDFDLELDEILPSALAAEVLGLAVIDEGGMKLTPVGRELLESGIQQRKEIFRNQLLKNETFSALLRELEAHGGRIGKVAMLKLFATKFKAANSREWLKVVINWGRYAELLGYDHGREEIYRMEHP